MDSTSSSGGPDEIVESDSDFDNDGPVTDGPVLDVIGRLFDIPRLPKQSDAAYLERIRARLLTPKSVGLLNKGMRVLPCSHTALSVLHEIIEDRDNKHHLYDEESGTLFDSRVPRDEGSLYYEGVPS
jgi:hypothetical protein